MRRIDEVKSRFADARRLAGVRKLVDVRRLWRGKICWREKVVGVSNMSKFVDIRDLT